MKRELKPEEKKKQDVLRVKVLIKLNTKSVGKRRMRTGMTEAIARKIAD